MKKCLIVSTVSRQFTLFEKGNIEVLKDLGYEIHCVANYTDETDELNELPIIKNHIDIQRSPFSFKNIKAYKQLKKIINKNDFQLIHCHTPMGSVLTRLAARKLRKNRKTKVIYTAHGFHFYKGAPIINWLIYYPIEKWLSKHTDCIITINEEDYNIAKKKFKSRQIELVNGIGVDKEKFDFEMTKENKEQLKKSLNLKKDDFVLIQVGELNKNKNQIMSIKAMKELVKENPNIHLLLVGKGTLENYYKEEIKKYKLQKNIHLLGYRKNIPELLKISDIQLSLSYREGLPINVIEGIISGVSIIATDCRGNRDLINKEYLVKGKELQALINQILKVKKNTVCTYKCNIDKYLKYNIKERMKEIYGEIEKKRIMHLLSTTTFSGAENVVCQIIKIFSEADWEMVYCSPKGAIKQKLEKENIKYISLNKMSYLYIKNAIKKYKPDIIHAHDIKASIFAGMFYKKNKIISHIHGNHNNMKKLSIKSILFYIFSKRFKKILWVSESAMQEYYFKNKVNQKSTVLVNVLDKNAIYEKLKTDKNEYRYDVIYLGRLSSEKDPFRVYEIMKQIVRNNNKIKCVFVGDGLLREELKQKIESDNMKENIILKGNMENPIKILKEAKVMIMASKYEGTPMCALEAMALGVPIVSTPTDGLVKLVKNNFNGFLSNDDKELALKVEEIVLNKRYREELNSNAIKRFIEINNIKEYKKRLENEYE